MDSSSTKGKILNAAIELFSERGFDKVSMRDIAGMVGIKAASIYNHFSSKRDILIFLYESYIREHRLGAPSIELPLRRLETEPIQKIILSLEYYWYPLSREKLDRVMLIASQRICQDEASENFIKELFFDSIKAVWIPLLDRAVTLGKIEPIDIEAFTHLAAHHAFSAAALKWTAMNVSKEQWNKNLSTLFLLLKSIDRE